MKVKDKNAMLARTRVWRHNSFLGQCKMAVANFRNMREADSITPECKSEIGNILFALEELYPKLKTRIDKETK